MRASRPRRRAIDGAPPCDASLYRISYFSAAFIALIVPAGILLFTYLSGLWAALSHSLLMSASISPRFLEFPDGARHGERLRASDFFRRII